MPVDMGKERFEIILLKNRLHTLGAGFLGIRLSLVPLRHVTALKRISFYLSFSLFFFTLPGFVRKGRYKDRLLLLISLFCAWALVSVAKNPETFESFRSLFNNLFKIALFYPLTMVFFKKNHERIYILALGAFPVLILTLTFLRIPIPFLPFNTYKTIIGGYYVITFPFSLLFLRSLLLCLLYFSLLFFYLLSIKAKAAMAMVFIIFSIWLLWRYGLKGVLVPVAVLTVLLFIPSSRDFVVKGFLKNRNITYRTTEIWPAAIKMIEKNPLFGLGYSKHTYEKNYLKFSPPPKNLPSIPPHAHNNFLSVALMMGIPGLVIFVLIIAVFIYRCVKRIKEPIVFAALLSFLGEFVLCGFVETHFIRFGELFFSLLAVPRCFDEDSP